MSKLTDRQRERIIRRQQVLDLLNKVPDCSAMFLAGWFSWEESIVTTRRFLREMVADGELKAGAGGKGGVSLKYRAAKEKTAGIELIEAGKVAFNPNEVAAEVSGFIEPGYNSDGILRRDQWNRPPMKNPDAMSSDARKFRQNSYLDNA